MPTRNDAWALLCEYTQNESLRKHALAVEACVRAYARKSGAEEELWGLTALLHDFDYERWPNDAHSPTEEHPAGGSAIRLCWQSMKDCESAGLAPPRCCAA